MYVSSNFKYSANVLIKFKNQGCRAYFFIFFILYQNYRPFFNLILAGDGA